MPLTCRRSFCVTSLTLSALLCTLPTMANTPVAAPTARTVLLRNVVPGDIVKALHWDQTANLPAGVTQVTSQPTTNSLSVVATPDGFAKVQQLVKDLDVLPRHVEIKFVQASATAANLKASGIHFDVATSSGVTSSAFMQSVGGNDVAAFLQTLRKQRAVTQAPTVTTSDNVDANMSMSFTIQTSAASPAPKSSEPTFETYAVTPHINSDNSVTLALHPVFRDGATKCEIKTTGTVKSGDTMVIAVLPASQTPDGKWILLFVTPTASPAENTSTSNK